MLPSARTKINLPPVNAPTVASLEIIAAGNSDATNGREEFFAQHPPMFLDATFLGRFCARGKHSNGFTANFEVCFIQALM
jgi:hypothetical protein